MIRPTRTPILFIILFLGVIFTGVATAVEAAGTCTFGAPPCCGNAPSLLPGEHQGRNPRDSEGPGHGAVDHLRSQIFKSGRQFVADVPGPCDIGITDPDKVFMCIA